MYASALSYEGRQHHLVDTQKLLKNKILATNYDKKCSEREHSKILIVREMSKIFREFCIVMQPTVNMINQ